MHWGMCYGRWWAFQWATPGFSLGIHIEPRTRRTNAGLTYGPYIDLHLPGVVVLSVGNRPIHAGEVDLLQSYSRGGIRGHSN